MFVVDFLQTEIKMRIIATMEKFKEKPNTRAIWIPKGAIFFTYDELSYLFGGFVVSEHVIPEEVERKFKEKKSQRDEYKVDVLVCEYSANAPDYVSYDLYEEALKQEIEIFDTIGSFIFQLRSYFSKSTLTKEESDDFDRIMDWLKKMTNDFSKEANLVIWNEVKSRYQYIGVRFRAFINFLEKYLRTGHKCEKVDTSKWF